MLIDIELQKLLKTTSDWKVFFYNFYELKI